jgi:hypothetical protein
MVSNLYQTSTMHFLYLRYDSYFGLLIIMLEKVASFQWFRSGLIVSWSGSIILGWITIRMWARIQKPKTGKYLQLKIYLFIFYFKNCNLLIPRPPWRTSKLQKKPSALKREHLALQNIKFLDPDPIYGSLLSFLASVLTDGRGRGTETVLIYSFIVAFT